MALVVVLAVIIGIALGMLGGGGSILTVPILVYGLGMEAKPAIATSLLVVGLASLAALVQHARAGRVSWRTGLFFGTAGMAGAYAGGRVAAFIPSAVLLVLFALMMLATAIAMLRRSAPSREDTTDGTGHDLPILMVVVEGLVVGAVTGLVGAGGGFLIVPALVLLGGMSMKRAVGTSLLVIAMKSLAGFAGYLGHVQVDWTLGGIIAVGAVAGTVVGTLLLRWISPESLRRAFGWFVALMAAFILSQQLLEQLWQTWA